MTERRQAHAIIAGVHPTGDSNDEPADDPPDNYDDPAEDPDEHFTPPGEDRTNPAAPDNIQSALLYRVGHRERHAYLRWQSHPAMLRSVAAHLDIPMDDIYDLLDVQARPIGLAPDAYPMIVHCHDDIAIGSDDQIAILDLLVYDHGNSWQTDRRTLLVPSSATRQQILALARVDRYCQQVADRCIVQHNHQLWKLQDSVPRELQHGAYFRIHVPPQDDSDLLTAQAIWQAQTQHSTPSSASATSYETAPHSRNEEPYSDEESEADDAQIDPSTESPDIPEELFDYDDDFHERLFHEWDDAAITEDEDMGPVAYFSTWYLSDRTMHRCNLPRSIGLLDDMTGGTGALLTFGEIMWTLTFP